MKNIIKIALGVVLLLAFPSKSEACWPNNPLDWYGDPGDDTWTTGNSDNIPVSIPGGFSQNQNYVITATPYKVVGGGPLNTANSYITVQYFDGLGRPTQTIQKGASPTGQDLVTALEYDSFGREWKSYLPVPATGNGGSGSYVSNLAAISLNAYSDSKPYSETAYEPSPLNRVERQYGPGVAWNSNSDGTGGHSVSAAYLTNNNTTDYLMCAYYYVSGDILTRGGNYAPNQLYVTETTDEDGNKSYEFKDKLGQVVLTRSIDKTKSGNARLHDTYYVYDDFGNLRYTLPPLASDELSGVSWTPDNQVLKDYAYMYKYDGRKRCIEKKFPGCDPVYMVYDKADRLILTQDGNQRAKSPKEWTFNKYDVFGRLIISGVYSDDKTRSELETEFKDDLIVENKDGYYGYTWTKMPRATYDKTLLVNHYDDYNHLLSQEPRFRDNLDYENKPEYGQRYGNGKGLLVGTRVKMLDSQTEIVTAMYYDDKGRVVQTKSINQLGGIDKEYAKYDFAGNPKNKLIVHGMGNIEERYRYDYDQAGRLLTTRHQIDNQNPIVMSEQFYDKFGRLSSKRLHGGVETITYGYNIRNWLKNMNSNRFQETLYYQDAPTGAASCYNGNISGMIWKVKQEPLQRLYSFSYDGLNRLTSSQYGEGPANAVTYNYLFNEGMSYDKHGNINTLVRNSVSASGNRAQALVNYMYYDYTGNQVTQISDYGMGGTAYSYGSQAFVKVNGFSYPAEYEYDKNGNMNVDYNRGIAKINYNLLNLPAEMQFKQGHIIQYGYDALGTKRVVETYAAKEGVNVQMGTMEPLAGSNILYHTREDYCGNAVYFGYGVGVSRLYTPEGYLVRQYGVSGDWIYYYTLKDHLGSVRSEFKGDGTNVGYTHYYASGIEITDPGMGTQTLQSRERFNGKEFQTDFGLNMLDYSKRFYDGARMQWPTLDPLAEIHPEISPYAYCLNNPVKYVDRDGRNPAIVVGGVVIGVGELALISAGVMTTGYILYRNQSGSISFTPSVQNMFSPSAPMQMGTRPSPGLTNQRQKEREAKEKLDKNQVNVGQTVVNGGHNPQEPVENFDPNNPKPGTLLKAAALATATAVGLEQINKNNDSPESESEQQPQQQEQQQQPPQQQQDPSIWERIKNFFNF